MVKVLKMENLECAHCAEKMEKKISKIEGVHSVSISFMAQKMILDCDDGMLEKILIKAQEAICSVEKDCVIKL